MSFSWHSYHRNPDWRQSERRASASTERMRDAYDGSKPVASILAPAQLRRQRERREAYREFRGRSGQSLAEVAIAVGLVLLVLAILISTWDKLV